MCHIHVQHGFYVTYYKCHKQVFLNKYKTIEYYNIPKSMCGIYVQHRGLCTTYMCNMDSMSYIKHVTHKNYQNEYKTLEYHVTHKSEALKYLKISFPHTCTTGILCNIAYMDTNFKNDMIIYMLHMT